MRDAIARLSDAMARDPSGMAWVQLADALRRAGQLDSADRTARRGLERHPYHPDGHDVLAKIAADGGDLGRARDEWEVALQLDPRHVGALLGLGWLAAQGGDHHAARRRWAMARDIAPTDPRVACVARQLRTTALRPTPPVVAPAAPRRESASLFASVERGGARFAFLLDDDGLVLAGHARDRAGVDHSDALAAELAGLSSEAAYALRQLHVGEWQRLLVECEDGTLALAPTPSATITLVATAANAPAGLARLLLERACRSAGKWLEAL